METRNCQNCKVDFIIEKGDFDFYKKINVPAPSHCRECRQMRRMTFRNERNLFKRKCDKTGKEIISIYSPDAPCRVYEYSYWYSDEFDSMEYGREYDFSKSFFTQFYEFMLDIPWPSLRIEASENCDYNNDVGRSKNLYLCSRTHKSRDMLYTYRGNSSSDCVDCMQVFEASEFLYECVECISCTKSSYLYFSNNCTDSSMLYNCKNCMSCFMCSNLRNKQYCFKNEQLSKEEYQKRIKDFFSGSYKERQKALIEFEDMCEKSIRKNLNIVNSSNSTGDNIVESKDSFMSFNLKSCENVRYMWDVMRNKDSMDSYAGGDAELLYECTTTGASNNAKFCYRGVHSRDVEYSFMVKNCKNVFACIGLENKEYCVLNKQYSQSEYEELTKKIKDQMVEAGEYGEFFPMNISLFAYNETVAQEYFPLTKEEAEKKGLRWRDPDTKSHVVTLKHEDIEDDINDISEEITKQTIGCIHADQSCEHGCTTAFRIIPKEFEFYKRMNLPLPRLCPNCRYYGRLKKLNPMKLWHRSCMCDISSHDHLSSSQGQSIGKCEVEFETSYSPDRPEKVYCEKCYQQEVL